GIWRDGAAVDDERGGIDGGKQVVGKIERFDMLAGRQHGYHDFGALNGLGCVGCGARARRHQALHGLRHQIEYGELMAGLDQVVRHGRAHVAQADERDTAHVGSPWFLLMATVMRGRAPEPGAGPRQPAYGLPEIGYRERRAFVPRW